MKAERLRVAMFSTLVGGGAGYAALRVHDSLRLGGADSTLYVGRAERSRHPGVQRIPSAKEGPQPSRIPGLTIFSVDPPGIPVHVLDDIIARSDVFSLQWYARFLSVRNIERLSRSGKPVLVTIRDMNPLSGGCHFFHGCDNWQHRCARCPQFIPENITVPGATLGAKKTLWDFNNITVVVLSDHTAALVERSPLFGGCRVEKIPNPMDVSIFKPHDRDEARAAFGIPHGKYAIAYLPSFSSSVKGAAQAVAALNRLADTMRTEDCVILCAGDLDRSLNFPFRTVNVGFIADKRKLAQFYSAADVTLIPSTEETFSNTAAESVACGTPIVGFQVGAIPELGQGNRGRVVPVDDLDALASAVMEVLSEEMAAPSQLHRYIAETFSAEAIGGCYLSLFDDLRAGNSFRASAQIHAPVGGWQDEAVSRFDQVLQQYRAMRLREPGKEQELLRQERLSPRWQIALFLRAARMFFFDNRAFRQRLWRFLSERH